jgi:hypothetical protein
MTVRELIAALQALPPEAQDYTVLRYCDWEVERIEVDWGYVEHNLPHAVSLI